MLLIVVWLRMQAQRPAFPTLHFWVLWAHLTCNDNMDIRFIFLYSRHSPKLVLHFQGWLTVYVCKTKGGKEERKSSWPPLESQVTSAAQQITCCACLIVCIWTHHWPSVRGCPPENCLCKTNWSHLWFMWQSTTPEIGHPDQPLPRNDNEWVGSCLIYCRVKSVPALSWVYMVPDRPFGSSVSLALLPVAQITLRRSFL